MGFKVRALSLRCNSGPRRTVMLDPSGSNLSYERSKIPRDDHSASDIARDKLQWRSTPDTLAAVLSEADRVHRAI